MVVGSLERDGGGTFGAERDGGFTFAGEEGSGAR